MEALGWLTAGLVHDLRNLLGCISGYAELIAGKVDELELSSYAAGITKAVQRADELARNVTSFSRGDAAPNETCDVATALAEDEPLLRHMVGQHTTLELNLASAGDQVALPAPFLRQIVFNLVQNAAAAVRETPSGRILVATYRVTADRRDEASAQLAESTDYLCLTVGDNGVGMDPATRARAFEPFFTTRARQENSGLGLVTIRRIVLRAGGRLYLESSPGKGTEIRVFLPIVGRVRGAATDAAGRE